MSAAGLQFALLGATLIGPGVGLPAVAPDCGIGHAPANVQRLTVASGDRLHSLLRGAGASANEIEKLRRTFGRKPNLHALSIGDRIDVAVDHRGAVTWFRFRHDQSHAVCAQPNLRDVFVLDRSEIRPEVRLAQVDVRIETKLDAALVAAGESKQLAVLVRDLFVERPLEPAEGELAPQLTLLVERRTIEGDLLDYGRIFAAELRQGERTERFFHYVSASGKRGYYTAQGKPRIGTRLVSPVPGVPVTSEFGMRQHPIKRRRRMHKGRDYGATHGTPVHAAADGVVVFKRYRRSLGRFVQLRHEDGLSTRYLHLSRWPNGLRSGQKVRQGQTIGYVGSTGLSSGAHLHFETLVGKRQVDPRKLLSAPAPELPASELEGFSEHVEELMGLMHPTPATGDGA